jgi:hypothetical protein
VVDDAAATGGIDEERPHAEMMPSRLPRYTRAFGQFDDGDGEEDVDVRSSALGIARV